MTDPNAAPEPPFPTVRPPEPTRGATLWGHFRGWRWWAQATCAVLFLPVVLAVFTLTRPAAARTKWWMLTAGTALLWVAVAVTADEPSPDTASPATSTSTTLPPSPVRPELVTVTAPEGGTRSGDTADLATSAAAIGADAIERAAATDDLLKVLASLRVEPEHDRAGYDRDLFPEWDDEDGDGCDSRCEVLSAQRHPDGSWVSEWDGYSTNDPHELQVDHVVALAEAWDSGADTWSATERDRFADHLPNLLAVSAASNLGKSDSDAAEWFPSRPEANCLWASTVVRVKDHWDLAVDPAEAEALGNLLRTCQDYVPPTTPTRPAPPTTIALVPLVPPTTTAAPPPSNCTPGYSPCIAPGSDVDCSGGSGNGPRYVNGPVQVDHAYGDPYGLDSDRDGIGCEG